jgi:hypothetical protein
MSKAPPGSVSMSGTDFRSPLGSRSDVTSAVHWPNAIYRRECDSPRSGVCNLRVVQVLGLIEILDCSPELRAARKYR